MGYSNVTFRIWSHKVQDMGDGDTRTQGLGFGIWGHREREHEVWGTGVRI